MDVHLGWLERSFVAARAARTVRSGR